MQQTTRQLRLLTICLLTILACTPFACKEGSDSESGIQNSISTLFNDLQNAIASNNIEGLEKVIREANKIRPSLNSQTQSKSLLIATAKEKLAKLKFIQLLTQSLAITTSFKLAEDQAYQVAILRSAADSIAEASSLTKQPVTGDITSAQNAKRSHFDKQLSSASAEVASLDSESQASRDKQYGLREEAERMLNDAEDAGIVDGHKTYKTGIRKLRQSQVLGMDAAAVELQSQLLILPKQEDAQAELEAVASILNGMKQTDTLLQELQNSSVQTAADFRQTASQLDSQTAETMNDALTLGTDLTKQWSELSTLVQDAMKGSSRGGSRDIQKTSDIWKLELEWTLGQVEEAKRTLLIEEARAIDALVEYGIITSADKWREISNSLATEIEQATISAISAYENAVMHASNAGSQGILLKQQLETRKALLSGEAVTLAPTNAESSSTTNTTTSGGGYATPLELVTAYNKAINLSSLDGSSNNIPLNTVLVGANTESEQLVTLLNGLTQSLNNLLKAVKINLGEDALQEFMSTNQTNKMMYKDILDSIDPTSITVLDDTSAAAREVGGKLVQLSNSGQGWKVAMGKDTTPEDAMLFSMAIPMFTTFTEVTDSLTAKVKSGELSTVEEINTESEKAMLENISPF
ncbi:MAG: hypothetical protein HN568_03615 [Phycisphaerae bacterium]|nr:hypothetical protein [Phycisphaerae bacterium]